MSLPNISILRRKIGLLCILLICDKTQIMEVNMEVQFLLWVFCLFVVVNPAVLEVGGEEMQKSLLSLGTGCVSQNWYLCLAASSMLLAGPWHADNSSMALWMSCNFCIGMVGF